MSSPYPHDDPPATVKRLIVNADDFGLTAGVTDGIIEAHLHGIVTSTSLMASGAAFFHAVRQAAAHPALDAGIHLTLVEEKPVAETGNIPTLARANGLLPANYRDLVFGVAVGRIRRKDIETEMRAQVEKCLAAGVQPTHLDSHQHVHAFPAILGIALRIAADYKIRAVRLPLDSPWGRDGFWSSRLAEKLALTLMARYDGRAIRRARLLACERAKGIFDSGALNEARLLKIIGGLTGGNTELVCHPGHEDPILMERYKHWKYRWREEFAALTSPAVRRAIIENGITLATYRDI